MNKIFHIRYRGRTYCVSRDALALAWEAGEFLPLAKAGEMIRISEAPTPPQVGSTASQDTNLPLQ